MKVFKFSLLILAVLLGFSCNKDNSLEIENDISITGKDLFKGVFFFRGELVKYTPSIRNSYNYFNYNKQNSTEKELALTQITDLINKMEFVNPEYFNNFKDIIKSKNPIAIQKAIEDGGEFIKKITFESTLTKKQLEDLSSLVEQINIEDFKDNNGFLNREKLQGAIVELGSTKFSSSLGEKIVVDYAYAYTHQIYAGIVVEFHVIVCIILGQPHDDDLSTELMIKDLVNLDFQ